MENGKTFTCMFPQSENVHLLKEIGMIPYTMQKHFGYHGQVVCYQNEKEYSYIENPLNNGLELCFVKKYTGNDILDFALYLLGHARNIDVLYLVHVTSKRNFYWILLYKLLHPRGKIYLKMDMSLDSMKCYNFQLKGIKRKIESFVLNKCSCISVETNYFKDLLEPIWKREISYIPNGFDKDILGESNSFIDKDNSIILCAGNLEDPTKNVGLLIQTFAEISSQIPNWKLQLVGRHTSQLLHEIDGWEYKHPNVKQRIELLGYIDEKKELYQTLRRAKICCVTSLFESFAFIALEAIALGCYLVCSDTVISASDLTDKGKYGSVFPCNNIDSLKTIIVQICSEQEKLDNTCIDSAEYITSNFEWIKLCKRIEDKLIEEGRK